ncbi:MAG: 50S ribosomal protein L11 methyltransferase [Bdellovibrionaceae bacterium]|nr:50S ribosomal protein L11 methyltransferase [Pseudobdellovibrionaceae bacterium]
MISQTTYFRIKIKNLSSETEATVTQHCFACGALGVSEALNFVQPNLVYDPKVLYAKNFAYDVYFSERPDGHFFDALTEIAPQISWEISEEESKDWLEEWKKGFKAFKLIDKYWVVPSWEPVPPECPTPIFIDPGMAFGTGTHATTQMASYLIVKYAKQQQELSKQTMLDIGTGTGILGILARHQGFSSILGLEVDPEAIRVAGENISKNNTTNFEISGTPVDEIRESYDLVVANIIDGVLLKIKSSLVKCMKAQGAMILTGILKEHESEFLTDFIEDKNLKIEMRLEKDDWIGYWVTHA